MVRSVKSLLEIAKEFPHARFSKEGCLILDLQAELVVEPEDLKYIGNQVVADRVSLPEEMYRKDS